MGKFSVPQTPPNVQNDYQKYKAEMEKAFVEFHKMFTNKVLDCNKSAAVKKTEFAIVDKLVKSIDALEKISVGEGLLAAAVISMREQLALKDRVNELEYELLKAKKTIEGLTGKKEEPKKP